MRNLGLTEIVLILLVVVLLFGGKKIPQLAKALGQTVGEFKKGIGAENESPSKKA